MAKVEVEFINTCSSCIGYEETIKKVASRFGDQVKVKIYHAGKDMDYIKKYGMVNKGTMIINGQKKYDALSPDVIEKAISEAVNE